MNLSRLIKNVVDLSFSWKECEHAICMRLAPDDHESEDKYRIWCEEAVTDLPPVMAGSTRFASLACGHTNTSLRAIQYGCLSTHPLLSDGTRYNIDNVRRKDAKLANAAEEGLWWWVLDAHVLAKYPALIRIFDASRNAATHVAAPESEVAGMNKLFKMWAKDEAAGKRGSYVTYAALVLRSRPPWEKEVTHFVPFLQNHAGGVKGAAWNEFCNRHSTLLRVRSGKCQG
jgi:hypothetical protein